MSPRQLVILDRDRASQLILNKEGQAKPTAYQFFTVKVLQTYNADSSFSMSLNNWAYLQTKQHPELKNFLSQFGFKHLSDWALLNRARPKQIEQLAERDRQIVEVYHSVYRRDRVRQRQPGARRCPDPSTVQLEEMLACLPAKNVAMETPAKLLQELKQIAVLSLKDIAPRLEMGNWDRARRILNPGELLNKVRVVVVQRLLTSILEKARAKGLTEIPPKPEYLQSVTEQIEAFADAEIFIEAAKEIRAGKNRKMESRYSQQLCLILNNVT